MKKFTLNKRRLLLAVIHRVFATLAERERERERARTMSGGIARGRLAEERKAWRKNHPHVSKPDLDPLLGSLCLVLDLFSVSRVSSLGRRLSLMALSISWSGIAPSPGSRGYCLIHLLPWSLWLFLVSFVWGVVLPGLVVDMWGLMMLCLGMLSLWFLWFDDQS